MTKEEKVKLARFAVKKLSSEMREVRGYEDPSRYTVKEYVHYLADIIADWDSIDGATYLLEWLEEYVDEKRRRIEEL